MSDVDVQLPEEPTEPAVQVPPATRTAVWRRRIIRSLVLYVLVPYIAVCVLFGVFQRRVIYRPDVTAPLDGALLQWPAERMAEVTVTASDGISLRGWHLLEKNRSFSQAEPATLASADFVVLYFPGNAGSRLDRLPDCGDFTDRGCDVLLFDYRGYGQTPGTPSEAMLMADARTLWSFVTETHQVPPDRVLLFGESLGGAVATALAAAVCQEGQPPAGLILNSTFGSMADVAAWHYPFFPVKWLLVDRYEAEKAMPHVTCPVVMFHCTADEIIPVASAERLFAAVPDVAANGTRKQMIEFIGGEHNLVPAETMHAFVAEMVSRGQQHY